MPATPERAERHRAQESPGCHAQERKDGVGKCPRLDLKAGAHRTHSRTWPVLGAAEECSLNERENQNCVRLTKSFPASLNHLYQTMGRDVRKGSPN